MTAIATTARHQVRVSAGAWVIALLTMTVVGLTAALIVSLTSSDGSAAPTRSTNGTTPTTSQVGGTQVVQGQLSKCPGSVKDYSC